MGGGNSKDNGKKDDKSKDKDKDKSVGTPNPPQNNSYNSIPSRTERGTLGQWVSILYLLIISSSFHNAAPRHSY
ncbi:hypothetical protein JTE90_005357 [Oedothorax gibbosus]|uniref:Uncharacterized protein n=1 Tax=Oedothorax gibbosus TaxID=931172 RepID=A0AAV6UJ89_9ARAC|nr:hypothetical protein JTE90_005357 [Oedothorax gibbosus]